MLKYHIHNLMVEGLNSQSLEVLKDHMQSFNPSRGHIQHFEGLKDCNCDASTIRMIMNVVIQPFEGLHLIIRMLLCAIL